MATLLAVRGIEATSPAFKRELVAMADRLQLNADYLGAVMSFETGGTFDPAQPNLGGSGATGLIQFMPEQAIRLGTTTSQLAEMSAVEQLAFVEQWYAPVKGALKTPADHYLAVFWPAGIGRPGETGIIFADGRHNKDPERGRRQYDMNSGLDRDRDGVITVNDAAGPVNALIESAQAKPRIEVPPLVSTPEAVGGVGGLFALMLFILGIHRFKKNGRLKS